MEQNNLLEQNYDSYNKYYKTYKAAYCKKQDCRCTITIQQNKWLQTDYTAKQEPLKKNRH